MYITEMLEKTKKSRLDDKEKFENLDENLCMLCGAYGHDKRSLFIRCFYDIKEVVPEALDLFEVENHKESGYYLRICKSCRGSLLSLLADWRNQRIDLREFLKDHDGGLLEEDLNFRNIPVRVNGAMVMMTEEEFYHHKNKV